MEELVRAKNPKTGREFTTSRRFAEKKGLKVLDAKSHRAVGPGGRVRPPKPRVTVTTSNTPQSGYPDGDPTDTWKADELKAYATSHNVDLTGATTKADILTAINDHSEGDKA